MTVFRFDIDGDKDVEDIAVFFALAASCVFNKRFPGENTRWQEAMVTLVRVVNEHVRTAEPPETFGSDVPFIVVSRE